MNIADFDEFDNLDDDYVALVIDDDVWMQRILSKILEGLGFIPHVASNGFDGVAAALEHKPTVIFLDIMMPELSGHLTLKLFKRNTATKDTPIVVVSALSDTENLGLAVKTGAVGFISKPFTRSTILDKLNSILGADVLNKVAERYQSPNRPASNIQSTSTPLSSDSLTSRLSEEPPEKIERKPTSAEIAMKEQESSNKKQIDAVKALLMKKK